MQDDSFGFTSQHAVQHVGNQCQLHGVTSDDGTLVARAAAAVGGNQLQGVRRVLGFARIRPRTHNLAA